MSKKTFAAAVQGFVSFVAEDGSRALISTGNYKDKDGADQPSNFATSTKEGVAGTNTLTVFLENGVTLTKGPALIRVYGDLSLGEHEGKVSATMNVRDAKQIGTPNGGSGLELSGFINKVDGNRVLLSTGSFKDKEGKTVYDAAVNLAIKKEVEGLAVPALSSRVVVKGSVSMDPWAKDEKSGVNYTVFVNNAKQMTVKEKAEAAPAEAPGADV